MEPKGDKQMMVRQLHQTNITQHFIEHHFYDLREEVDGEDPVCFGEKRVVTWELCTFYSICL